VDQLKQVRNLERTIRQKDREIGRLQARVQELERSIDRERGNMSRWGTEREVEHEIEF